MNIWRFHRARLSDVVIPVGAVLAVMGSSVAPSAAAPLRAESSAVGATASCASLTALSLPNTTINSAVDTPAGTVPPPFPGLPPTPVVATCRVHATVTTPGVNDHIGIDVWMPVSGWNGRFQGVGGSGYTAGDPNNLAGPVDGGYSAASTDGGHTGSPVDGSFALDSKGRLIWPAIQDFAYRAVHDLALVGKAVTAAYYGSQPSFSYWNGCSTGGRQGLAEAQRYPSDFNGILAGAPAINWQRYVPASLWPELAMLHAGDFLPQCKFSAFRGAAIKACDTLGDGVVDGVIGDPLACHFNPNSLVGTSTPCGTITAQDAAVVAKIMEGARTTSGAFLWSGLLWGAQYGGDWLTGSFFPFAGIANTITSGGTTVGSPFPLTLEHLGTWVQQNPPVPAGTFDWTTLTADQFDQLFQQSVEMYGDVIGTDNPDLSGFKKAGGRLIIWHGLADQLIFPQGSINYYTRVQRLMGDSNKTTNFARLFLAPGVAHCGFGPGAQPANPLNQLVTWVESGQAPSSLNGVTVDPSTGAVTGTRPICMYPNLAVYQGSGPTTQASSFACKPSREED